MKNMGIREVLIAPRSPWQSPYVERVIGTLRRELLDHVIVLGEEHLRRLLWEYVHDYYHPCRTHLSLSKDPPAGREIEPPEPEPRRRPRQTAVACVNRVSGRNRRSKWIDG